MQDERVAINRATMTKFGIKVAELTVMFIKDWYVWITKIRLC